MQKDNKNNWLYSGLGFVFSLLLGLGIFSWSNQKQTTWVQGQNDFSSVDDFYSSKVQKVFNNRCVACHGCYEAPCQLNLQSYDGLLRGVHSDLVYDGARTKLAIPTRLDFDGNHSTWGKLGFQPVIGDSNQSVLLNSLDLTLNSRVAPKNSYPEGRQCLNQNTPDLAAKMKNPSLGMPYNFTSVSSADYQVIADWIKMGAPAPAPVDLVVKDSQAGPIIDNWNSFLNTPGYKHQLTARYLYEHLYLAHLYLSEKPREFYRVIRSKTSCDAPEMIHSRRANTDPGVANFFYCIVKYPVSIASKNHLPYSIDLNKLRRIEQLFIEPKWAVENDKLPSYDAELAADPFATFKNIPQESRYRYLLDDSQYQVMTFIKGPVCNGSTAVNSIQDRFYVFFMDPKWDSKINTQTLLERHKLPGEYGDDALKVLGSAYVKLINRRKETRQIVNKILEKEAPKGLPIDAVWNGDGFNENAVLTVFRHDDNAAVLKGPVGDVTKTAFMLDYSTFERLVYNLVVNFDVYGTAGHQLLSRVYMDLIRMDAEDTYLNYLPQASRKRYKQEWYSDRASSENWTDIAKSYGFLKERPELATKVGGAAASFMIFFKNSGVTALQQKFLYTEDNYPNIPEAIDFKTRSNGNVHLEFIQKIFERLGNKVIPQLDQLNWRTVISAEAKDPIDAKFASVSKAEKQNYARYFPELSFIVIGQSDSPSAKDYTRYYSMAHSREFNSIAWFINESGRRLPEEDVLVFSRLAIGSHPNQFFYVSEAKIPEFTTELKKISNPAEYAAFLKKYGITRVHPNVWDLYDFINSEFVRIEKEQAGYLDLFRYSY